MFIKTIKKGTKASQLFISQCRSDGASLLTFTAQFNTLFRCLYISCHAYKVDDVRVTVFGHFSIVRYINPLKRTATRFTMSLQERNYL